MDTLKISGDFSVLTASDKEQIVEFAMDLAEEFSDNDITAEIKKVEPIAQSIIAFFEQKMKKVLLDKGLKEAALIVQTETLRERKDRKNIVVPETKANNFDACDLLNKPEYIPTWMNSPHVEKWYNKYMVGVDSAKGERSVAHLQQIVTPFPLRKVISENRIPREMLSRYANPNEAQEKLEALICEQMRRAADRAIFEASTYEIQEDHVQQQSILRTTTVLADLKPLMEDPDRLQSILNSIP